LARSERLLQLMQCLRRYRRPVRAATLAEELGVSVRTLYRDIATLQAQGADIEGETGVGYILKPGFTLPPMNLSATEVEALMLGAHWVVNQADPELKAAARDVIAKLSAVLPTELSQELEATPLLAGPSPAGEQPDPHLQTLRRAIRAEQCVSLNYRNEAGQLSERVVWPIAIGFFTDARILIAWCEQRQAMRHFRTDRINQLSLLERRYPKSRRALLRLWREQQQLADRLLDNGY